MKNRTNPSSCGCSSTKSVVETFANRPSGSHAAIYPTREDSVGVALFATGGPATFTTITAWDMMARESLLTIRGPADEPPTIDFDGTCAVLAFVHLAVFSVELCPGNGGAAIGPFLFLDPHFRVDG